MKNIYECNNDCSCCGCVDDCSCECNKYKKKSDELYSDAQCLQIEAQRHMCEARQLEATAREYEAKAKQFYARSQEAWDKACRLENKSTELLELAQAYFCNASECNKSLHCVCDSMPSKDCCCSCKPSNDCCCSSKCFSLKKDHC